MRDHEVFEDAQIIRQYQSAIPQTSMAYQRRILQQVLGSGEKHRPRRSGWRSRWTPAVVVLAAVLAAGTALALVNLANLGAPTDDVPGPPARLGGFYPGAPVLRQQGKVEVLVFESLWDGGSALERWPLVKALGQFGTWTGLAPGKATEPLVPAHRGASGQVIPPWPPFPTFDLSHARYSSSYVVLVDRVVQVHSQGPSRPLPSTERALLARFRRAPPAVQLMGGNGRPLPVPFPVVIVGGYGERGPFEDPGFVEAAITGQGPPTWQTFSSLRKQFLIGDEAPGTGWMVREFNAATNVITALICHADGNRPAVTCNRPAIRAILQRVR